MSLQIGERKWNDKRIIVMNLSGVSCSYGHTVDGLPGLDILREFKNAVIEFREHVLLSSG